MKHKFGIIILTALAAILFCSCSTIRNAREAQKPENQKPGERTITASELGLTPEKTMTLPDLEKIALNYHPNVILAQQNLAAAQIALLEAGATDIPTLDASASHNRSTNNRDRHHFSTSNDGSWAGTLSMHWTAIDFGKTSLDVKRARENLRASELELLNAEALVVYNVRKAFFELHRAIELDKVAQEAVSQYYEHLEQIKAKRTVGKSSAYDLIKAEVDWNSAIFSQLTTSNNVDDAWGELNRCLGLAEEPHYQLDQGNFKKYDLNVESLVATAYEMEPTLASLKAKATAASTYVDRMIAELYPTLSLSLSANASGRNTGLPWLTNLSAGASLSDNIYNAGSNMRRIEDAVIALRKARTNVSSREQELFQNIRKAVLVAIKADKQYEVASLTERQAQQNLDIVNQKFSVGTASSVERTDAQVSHSQAKAAVITARFDKLESQAAIAYLIGDFEYSDGEAPAATTSEAPAETDASATPQTAAPTDGTAATK